MNSINAYYYPPGKSHRTNVTIACDANGDLEVTTAMGELVASQNLKLAQVSERITDIPRFLRFPDGSVVETSRNDLIDGWQSRVSTGTAGRTVARLESKWRYAFGALAVIAFALFAFFQFVLPPIAAEIARVVPVNVETQISKNGLEYLDNQMLELSTLSKSRQSEIWDDFDELVNNIDSKYHYDLQFRTGIGPNAFALPGGKIIITDEFVQMAETDAEIIAVLAHEIAHVENQHTLRALIKDAASLVVLLTLFGDVSQVSSLAATMPTFMMGMHFSRSQETESDSYAVDYMLKHDIDPMALASILTKITEAGGDDSLSNYFLTHPGIEKRIENIRRMVE